MIAYDHLLCAKWHMRRYAEQDERAARDHLVRALGLDPEFAAAYATLALSHIHEYESTWSRDRGRAAAQAFELAERAVALDGADSAAHRALAYAAHYRGHCELATKEIGLALDLNPNDYPNYCVVSWILLFNGRPTEALARLYTAMRLNPLASENCLLSIGIAQYAARLYEDAARTFASMHSWNTLRYAGLAASYGHLGLIAEARAATASLLESARAEFGGSGADATARWWDYLGSMFRFRDPGDWRHLLDGFDKAGLRVAALDAHPAAAK